MNGNEFTMSHGHNHIAHAAGTIQHQNKMINGNTMPPTHYLNETDMTMRYSFNDPGSVSLLVPVFFAQRPEATNVFPYSHQPYLEENYHPACTASHGMTKPPSFLEFMASDVAYPPHFSYHESGVATSHSQSVPNSMPGLIDCSSKVPPTTVSNTAIAQVYNPMSVQNFPSQTKKPEDGPISNVTAEKTHSPQTYQSSHQIDGGKKTKQKAVSKCELCSQTFSRPDNLKRHMRNIHTLTSSTGYVCHKCGKEIKRHDNLVHHELQCSGSGKATESSRLLYDCTICSKSYYRKQDLKRHMSVVHTEVKSLFGCAECSFTTPYKVVLKRHCHMFHQQYKSLYSCQQCGVDFRTLHGITKHRRSNDCSTIDATTCKICMTSFRTLNRLKEHFRSEHYQALTLFVETGEDTEDCFSNFSVSELSNIEETTDTPEDLMPSLIVSGTSE